MNYNNKYVWNQHIKICEYYIKDDTRYIFGVKRFPFAYYKCSWQYFYICRAWLDNGFQNLPYSIFLSEMM
jgi:hypothetical protein